MAALAALCMKSDEKFRPSMSMVVKALTRRHGLVPGHCRNLSCGGTILCTAISHYRIAFANPEYTTDFASIADAATVEAWSRHFALQLSPVLVTFTAAQVARLKKLFAPSSSLGGCTSFEVHVWCEWVRSLDPPSSLRIKLLFTMEVRQLLFKEPELSREYYGNGFVMVCTESTAGELAAAAPHAVRLVQESKRGSMTTRGCFPDQAMTFTISSLAHLDLEDIDFGAGRPIHFGPLTIYCVFLPVIGDPRGTTAIVSMPQAVADRFERLCLDGLDAVDEEDEIQKLHI
uniref:Uncharacterized protein n=1 Tax=Leersia perrieri TaxID=77586 RepID=A0A0D9V172_9ORYZ